MNLRKWSIWIEVMDIIFATWNSFRIFFFDFENECAWTQLSGNCTQMSHFKTLKQFISNLKRHLCNDLTWLVDSMLSYYCKYCVKIISIPTYEFRDISNTAVQISLFENTLIQNGKLVCCCLKAESHFFNQY